MELDSNNHSVFLLNYHLVLVVKYRRNVIDNEISDRLKEIFEYICPKTPSSKYYISILVDTENIKLPKTDKKIGVDMA